MSYKIELKDALKGYTYDQDKIMSPEETVAGFKEKTAKLNLDILSQTRRIDNGRLDIPVFFSECGSDAKDVVGTKKQMGKGGTPAQSEASAVMELAERFSFFSFMKKEDHFFYRTQFLLQFSTNKTNSIRLGSSGIINRFKNRRNRISFYK